MAETFQDSIRKIAETEELKEAVKKALDVVSPDPKDDLDAYRQAGSYAGGEGFDHAGGAPQTSGLQDVVDASGLISSPPASSPPSSAAVNAAKSASTSTSTTSTDSIDEYRRLSGIVEREVAKSLQEQLDQLKKDLENQGSGGGGGGGSAGGSKANEQGQTVSNPDHSNPTQEEIDAYRESIGASAAEVEKRREQDQQLENGTMGTVSADGLANGNQTPALFTGKGLTEQSIDGVVGIDPANPTKTIVTNIKGLKSYIPSLADSLNAGQSQWTSADHPPTALGWQFGYYYQGIGGYVGTITGATPSGFAQRSVGFVHPSFGYVVEKVRNITYHYSGSDITEVDFEAYLNWDDTATPINTGWADAVITTSKISCSSMGTALCPLTAPSELYWPKTGTAILNFVDGVLKYSPFDSEIPDKYKNNISSTVEYLLRNGEIWSLSPAVSAGFLYLNTATQNGIYLDSEGRFTSTVSSDTVKYFKPK